MGGYFEKYEFNLYSQFGEDGVIQEILRRIEISHNLDHWCVEFGAWDGVYLSNTCRLIREKNYSAVLIEGEPDRVADLHNSHPQDSVHKINRFVELVGENSLDEILASTPIPKNFDLLSIDIDGCDYWILDSLKKYVPKVVVIEYNPTIPNSVDFIQENEFKVKKGSAPRSIVSLAQQKGYVLIVATTTNLLFVAKGFVEAVLGKDIPEQSLEQIRDDSEWDVKIFSTYDGTLYLSKPLRMPWLDVRLSPDSLQVVPKSLQAFPSDWSKPKRVIWAIYFSIFRRKFL